MKSLDEVVIELDEASNNRDKEAVLRFYEEDALLVIEPGRIAQGKKEIAAYFDNVLDMNIKANQIITNVMQTGDIALFT